MNRQWFLLFEDLYNGEGSLQANKTSKKQNFFNFLSFKKEKKKEKKSCNILVKLHFYYYTQKYDT